MALILDGNGLIQGLSAGGLPDGSIDADSLASTLNLSSKTMTFGNVTASGITFPASVSASGNPNTLDDYEEGTWTPAFVAASGSATYTNQQGTYTKIGRQVTAVFYITVNTSSSLTSTGISGLPFTGSSTNYAGTSFSVWSGIGGYCNVIGLTGAATTIQIRSTDSATAAPGLNTLTVSNGADIAGTITYFT
jgi:hypothetical protein